MDRTMAGLSSICIRSEPLSDFINNTAAIRYSTVHNPSMDTQTRRKNVFLAHLHIHSRLWLGPRKTNSSSDRTDTVPNGTGGRAPSPGSSNSPRSSRVHWESGQSETGAHSTPTSSQNVQSRNSTRSNSWACKTVPDCRIAGTPLPRTARTPDNSAACTGGCPTGCDAAPAGPPSGTHSGRRNTRNDPSPPHRHSPGPPRPPGRPTRTVQRDFAVWPSNSTPINAAHAQSVYD